MTFTFPVRHSSYARSSRACRNADGVLFGSTSAPKTTATSRTGTLAAVYVRPADAPHAYRVGLKPSTPATATATATRPSTRPCRRGKGTALLTGQGYVAEGQPGLLRNSPGFG